MRSLTWAEVRARRLRRSRLLAPAPRSQVADVVGSICGLQAQVLSAAELGLGLRIEGLTEAGVREELWERRTLAKAWAIRGTIHLVPAAELSLWTAAVRGCGLGAWWERFDLTRKRGEAVLEAIRGALDAGPLTREELAYEAAHRAGPWAREPLTSQWGGLLGVATLHGYLCHGPNRGTKVTFVRPDRWLGPQAEHEPGAALAEVARRYVGAYGPSTHTDLAEWLSIRPGEARALLEALELEAVDVEGRRAWVLAGDDAFAEVGRSVRLVPQYDQYLIGSRPRRVLPEAARARVHGYRRGKYEGVIALSALLVGGVVAGIWDRRSRGNGIEVRVETFGRVPKRELAAEVDRLAGYYGREVSLTLGTLD
jgi:Winged helix DNA-binding domain